MTDGLPPEGTRVFVPATFEVHLLMALDLGPCATVLSSGHIQIPVGAVGEVQRWKPTGDLYVDFGTLLGKFYVQPGDVRWGSEPAER